MQCREFGLHQPPPSPIAAVSSPWRILQPAAPLQHRQPRRRPAVRLCRRATVGAARVVAAAAGGARAVLSAPAYVRACAPARGARCQNRRGGLPVYCEQAENAPRPARRRVRPASSPRCARRWCATSLAAPAARGARGPHDIGLSSLSRRPRPPPPRPCGLGIARPSSPPTPRAVSKSAAAALSSGARSTSPLLRAAALRSPPRWLDAPAPWRAT